MGNFLKFGLCCISLALKNRGLGMRALTYKNFCALEIGYAFSKLSEICLNYGNYVLEAVKFCGQSGIAHFRVSSSIFPLLTHPNLHLRISDLKDSKQTISGLSRAGRLAKSGGISLSFHPSQYVAIVSADAEVREAAARDINLNAEILDLIGASKNISNPINIHINRSPKSPDFICDFESGISLLSSSARRRLSIENEDRGFWNTANLLKFLRSYKIPLSFDILHERCNQSGLSEFKLADLCAKTWGGHTPIFHHSESASKSKPRSHSEFCKHLPPNYGFEYICMIEAKAKDLAIKKLQLKIKRNENSKIIENTVA